MTVKTKSKKKTKTKPVISASKAKPEAKPKAKSVKAAPEKHAPENVMAEEKTNKKATIITMLKREEGATLQQLMDATKWQRHSVHGQLANLHSKQKLEINQTKESGKDTVYRIA